MSISSIVFILGVMPLSMLLYYILPERVKNVFLLIISLVFYSWGNISHTVILILSIVFNYFTGLQIEESPYGANNKKRKRTLVTGIIFNIMLLAFFKYYGFILNNLNLLFHIEIPVKSFAFPLGISFFTFSSLSYLFDVYRREAMAQKNILNMALYISFFPKITSGPIVRYVDMEGQFKSHPLDINNLSTGFTMLIRGLGKKVILADSFGLMFSSIKELSPANVTVVSTFLLAIAYTLQIYLDFSGYSDMAIGISKMLGFDFKKNFDYPYTSLSVTEFWRRWHISLGAWFREYVYIPLGGNRNGILSHIRNILIVWALTGIWHGASWTFIVWGLYYGVIMIIEKYLFGKILSRLPNSVANIITMVIVMIGWIIFSADSIGDAFVRIGNLVGIGTSGFINMNCWYFIKAYFLRIIIGAFISMPVCLNIYEGIFNKEDKRFQYASVAIYLTLFLVSLAYLVSSNYQSFLYANF